MAIDLAIRSNRFPDDRVLAEELGVDRRTIRRDLAEMRDELRAPVEFNRERRGYWYSEPTYRLPAFVLAEGELISLFLAERMMREFRGTT